MTEPLRTAVLALLVVPLAACSVPAPDPRELALVVSFDQADPLVELRPLQADQRTPSVDPTCLELPRDTVVQLNRLALPAVSLGGFVRQPESWREGSCAPAQFTRPELDHDFWVPPVGDISLTLAGGEVQAGAEWPDDRSSKLLVDSPRGPLHPGDVVVAHFEPDVGTLEAEWTHVAFIRADGRQLQLPAHNAFAVDGTRVVVPIVEGYCTGVCTLNVQARAFAHPRSCDFGRCDLIRLELGDVDLEFAP